MENKSSPFFHPDWLKLQQQYTDAFASMGAEQSGDSGKHPPWQDFLNQWRQTLDKDLPGSVKPLFANIQQQSTVFYSLADEFASLLNTIKTAGPTSGDWRSLLADFIAGLKRQFDNVGMDNKGWSSMSSFLRSPLHYGWWQAMQSSTPFVDTLFETASNQSHEKMQQYFSMMPGFGPTREFQEKLSQAGLLLQDYQKHYQTYQQALTKLGKQSLDRLEQKIVDLANAQQKITSLRQIYNLWIDASEETYSRHAFDDGHAIMYANLVNALMKYRLQSNVIMDMVLEVMNLPTSAGMNTVIKRQQQMRNSVQQFQSELDQIRRTVKKKTGAGSSPVARKPVAARKKKTTPKPE